LPPRRRKDTDLPACVYRKDGAYWYVKDNRWRRLGPIGDAAALAAALEAYAHLQELEADGGMPALIHDALAHLAARKIPLAPNTLLNYRTAGKILARKLRAFRPSQVEERHVSQVKAGLKRTPNMANRCLSLLRQVFAYAMEERPELGVKANPAATVKRHPEGKRDRLISAEEYAAIYAHAGPRLQVAMDLAIRTGQRVNAVLKIERSQLTEHGIRFGKFKTDTKGIVAWTPELREVVERAKALGGPVSDLTWLVPGVYHPERKADYRSVKEQWDRACKAAGVTGAQLRDLRAVAATAAKRQGLNPQALLQHTSAAQTERYLRGKEEPISTPPSFSKTRHR
jgi:integrase